jgi:hypothetical protein
VTRTSVRVVLALVALSSDSAIRPPQLVGYHPDGAWPSRTLPASGPAINPQAAAEELLDRCGPRLTREIPAERRAALEPVTFITHPDGGVDLVYTAPVPLTAVLVDDQLLPLTDPHPQPPWLALTPDLPVRPNPTAARPTSLDRWTRSVTKVLADTDPVRYAVLDHWRQLVEETTAASELLPRYFTITQLRAVYDAIWGDPQDPGNFHSWVMRSNGGMCTPVDPARIRRDLDAAAHPHLTDSSGSNRRTSNGHPTSRLAISSLTAQLAGPGLVGTSPLALGRAVATLGGLGPAIALTGGLIAHQAARTPGKKATWYQHARPTRTILKVLYSPRPAWRAPGVDAAAGRRPDIQPARGR